MATADRFADRKSHAWPDPLQTALLKALRLEGPAAAAALERWLARADLDAVDYGSYRLLPELYARLKERGVEHRWMGRLKGLYRHTWYRNQALFAAAAGVLESICGNGIEVMLLKGAALTRGYYESPGLRPMDDVDFLVREGEAPTVARLLEALGWVPDRDFSDPAATMARFHSSGFKGPGGGNIDLHWRLHQERMERGRDSVYWNRSRPGDLQGLPVRLPHPAHLLAHVLIHGLTRSPLPGIRWAADAAEVLARTGGRMDWDPFVSEAALHRVAPFFRDALVWLREELDAPVPPKSLSRLTAVPAPLRIRILYLCRMRKSRLWPALYEAVPWEGLTEIRQRGPLAYLMERWDLSTPHQVAPAACRYALRKVREFLNQLS